MTRAERGATAAAAGLIAFALAYVGVAYGKVPHWTYHPLDRTWRFAAAPSALEIGYPGQWLWAWIAAAAMALAVWGVLGWRRRPLGERARALAVAWTGTALAIALGYTAWNNWP
jgi:hypothetical protein